MMKEEEERVNEQNNATKRADFMLCYQHGEHLTNLLHPAKKKKKFSLFIVNLSKHQNYCCLL